MPRLPAQAQLLMYVASRRSGIGADAATFGAGAASWGLCAPLVALRGRVEFCWLRLRVPAMPDAPLHASWKRNSLGGRGFARGSRLCCARSVCRGTEDAASLVSRHRGLLCRGTLLLPRSPPPRLSSRPSLAPPHLSSPPSLAPPHLSSRPSLAATSPVFSSLARRHLTCVLVPRSPPPHLSSRPSIAATSPVFSSLDRLRLARLLPQAWPAAAATPCEEGCLPLHSACAAAPPEVIAEVAAASRYRPAICRSYTVNIRTVTWPVLPRDSQTAGCAATGPLRGASPLH